MRDFEKEEQNILNVEKTAIEGVRKEFEPLKVQNVYSNSLSNMDEVSNNFGMQGAPVKENTKILVRTIGTPNGMSSSSVPRKIVNDITSDVNRFENVQSESYSQSQSGNVSTGTLLIVFGIILVIMVFMVSYLIFTYLGS